jgi:hypothetical protein
MYKIIITTLILLFFQNCSAQKIQSSIDIFKNRFENRNTIIEELTKRLNKANKQEKVLLYSLLSLSNNYLKNQEGIKQNLKKAEEILPINTKSLSYAYYQYATAKYYLMLDQNDKSVNHFLNSFDIFKLNNDYDSASEMAININYLIENKTLKYLLFSKKLLPKINCKSSAKKWTDLSQN